MAFQAHLLAVWPASTLSSFDAAMRLAASGVRVAPIGANNRTVLLDPISSASACGDTVAAMWRVALGARVGVVIEMTDGEQINPLFTIVQERPRRGGGRVVLAMMTSIDDELEFGGGLANAASLAA